MKVGQYSGHFTSRLTDTTVVNALFGYFDIFIPLELSLYRASDGELIFVVSFCY